MAEGGLLAWKIQKLKSRGPVVSYSKEALTLPDPPEGKKWSLDEDTREWTLIDDDEEETTASAVVVIAAAAPVVTPTTETKNNNTDTTISKKSPNDTKSTSNEQPPSPPPRYTTIDYIEHTTLPTDTLQGLCIAYKTTATKIRQTNGFSGNNLLLAPSTLVIPVSRKELARGRIRLQDRESREFKRQVFVEKVKGMGLREADAYLDMAEGDLEQAINDALEDCEWEKQEQRRTTKSKNNGGRWKNNREGLPLDTSIHEAVPIHSGKVHRGAKKKIRVGDAETSLKRCTD